MKFKYILIIVGLILVGFVFWVNQMDISIPEGYTFCTKKGFDSVSLTGSYSEKFGKVECMSSYKDKIILEEFEVIKKFGIIMDANLEKKE